MRPVLIVGRWTGRRGEQGELSGDVEQLRAELTRKVRNEAEVAARREAELDAIDRAEFEESIGQKLD